MKLAKRLGVGFACVFLSFSMMLQQTQAYPLWWNTPSKETQTFRPGWFQTVGGYMSLGWLAVRNSWLPSFERGSAAPRGGGPPITHAGMPWAWEALDVFLAAGGIPGSVNLANGNQFSSVHMIDFAGHSTVSFDLYYNSNGTVGMSSVGGWRHSYSDTLEFPNQNNTVLRTSDGREITFTLNASVWDPPTGVWLELTYDSGLDEYTVKDKQQNTRVFDGAGKLLSVINDLGHPLDMVYTSGLLTRIRQTFFPAGPENWIDLDYTDSLLTKVTGPSITNSGDPEVEVIREFELQYNPSDKLVKVSSARQTAGVHDYFAVFNYNAQGTVSKISDYNDDDGGGFDTTVSISYLNNRVQHVVYPEECDYAYDSAVHSAIPWPGSVGASCNETGTLLKTYKKYIYLDHPSGEVKKAKVRDERGNQTRHEFDTFGRLIAVRDQLNRVVSQLVWNANNEMTSVTNVLGSVTTMEYNHQPGNVTRIIDDLLNETLMTYDSLNNITEVTDAVGNVTSFTYDSTFPTLVSEVDYNTDTTPSAVLSIVYGTTAEDSGLPIQTFDGNLVPSEREYEDGYETCSEYGHMGDYVPPGMGARASLACMDDQSCVENDAVGNSKKVVSGGCASCRNFNQHNADNLVSELQCDCDTGSVGIARGSTPRAVCEWTGDQIKYDGNTNISAVRNDMDSGSVIYNNTYDVRNRITQKDVTEDAGCGAEIGNDGSADFGGNLYADFTFDVEYSSITGQRKTTYTRTNTEFPVVSRDPIVTETFTDAMGRATKITRDGTDVANYYYFDSTILPAIVEIKPRGIDNLVTEYYIDDLGQIRLITHEWNGSSKAEFEYTRDANGRVTKLEAIFNGGNIITTNYAYGAGSPDILTDLDPGQNTIDKEQLYWNWTARGDIDQGLMLRPGNPFNLVKEERIEGSGAGQVKDVSEYFYDRGGNRISKRQEVFLGESSPVKQWTRVTRYSYAYNSSVTGAPVYTDIVTLNEGGNAANDYGANIVHSGDLAYGRNELQFYSTYCTDHATTGECNNPPTHDDWAEERVDYEHDNAGQLTSREGDIIGPDEVPVYDISHHYKKGLLQWVDMTAEPDAVLAEVYGYDAFGMRIAKDADNGPADAGCPLLGARAQGSNGAELGDEHHGTMVKRSNEAELGDGHHPMMGKRCFFVSPLMYDRDVQGRIIAERRQRESYDHFLSTYTYGALGLISRTDEKLDHFTSNNEDYLYLADAMGNHVGLIDGDGTARIQEFDAFGVSLDTLILDNDTSLYYKVLPGQYMWRGAEGSETDVQAENCTAEFLSNRLVHMGVRYYEPDTGRFTQRDPLGVGGSPITFIPYLYGEND
ncbi:MAG: hypothetical protein IH988_03310, partial [Planctomycetes bacterium]|nr:hypothetical protein [Planctomycetota bacterium]